MRLSRSVLCGCIAVIACGQATTGVDGGVSGTDAGVLGVDGGTAGVRKSGLISVNQTSLSGSISAAFAQSAGAGLGCTTTTHGSCTVVACVAPSDAGVASSRLVGAGTLTITGTAIDAGIVVDDSGGFDGYFTTVSQPLWSGGETISVSSTGGVVPAFAAQSATAPSILTVTAPTCTNLACGTVSRSSPLVVTWAGGTSGTVNAVLTVSTSSPLSSTVVTCTALATAGSLTVDVASLGALPADLSGTIAVSNVGSTTFSAGDFPITFTLTSPSLLGASATFH